MNRERFIIEVAKKMREGMCDLFVGSGISAPSNIPTWNAFLSPYLSEIGIQLQDEDNLPLLAQYIVNSNIGNRNLICGAIFDTFGKDYRLNLYHKIIRNLPVKTVWTTNYDCLLELAFADSNVRVITSEDTIKDPHNNADVEIVKLHGCARAAAQGIILTQSDYDCFLGEKPKLAQRLREAIINRSILFLGYSYHDPDIQTIMTQAYQMMGRVTGTHYILLLEIERWDNEEEEHFNQRRIRFDFWRSELNRIGLQDLCVPKTDFANVLRQINQASHEMAVFVTGTHEADGSLEKFARKIGKQLAEMPEAILNYGQSAGVGSSAMSSFMEHVVTGQQDINHRLHIFPNPYAISPEYSNNRELIEDLKKARTPLIANSSIVIAFPGGMGTKAEVELALDKDKLVFPVVRELKHFENDVITFLLADNPLLAKNAPQYYEKLKEGEVPSEEETLVAIQEVINGKKTNCN